MIILNTDKLIKIKYHEKQISGRYYLDKENKIMTYSAFMGYAFVVNEKTLENNDCYLEDGNVFYYPSLVFFSNDGSTETKYFKTTESAKAMIEKIKQEPDLKLLTIE